MNNNLLLNSPSALNDFLIIINAYGAFLKERELVKKRKQQKNESPIVQLVNSNKIDHYSSSSREFGYSDGLTESSANELNSLISKTFSNEYELLKKNLISTEKYFKKLKYQFKDKYPQFKTELDELIKVHQEKYQEHKQVQHKKHNQILDLSDSFISFFHYTFGGSQGIHIAYSAFSKTILRKYNIFYDQDTFNKIYDAIDLDIYRKESILKLNIEQINFMAEILGEIISSTTEQDLNDTLSYTISARVSANNNTYDTSKLSEKEKVAKKIINDNFRRFEVLFNKYLNLKEEANELL